MKAKLTFDLSNQDDKENYEIYSKALDYHCALFEIAVNLRKKIERGLEEKELSGFDTCERIFEEISDVLEYNDIRF